MSVRVEPFMRCPLCCQKLATAGLEAVRCDGGHEFPALGGIMDLIGGAAEVHGLFGTNTHGESSGIVYRTENYVLPWIRNNFGSRSIRLLEDGCGLGDGVDYLAERGIDAWGIDVGVRSESWAKLANKDRLLLADGTNLPFDDQAFDIVTSSGVLEHIGEPRPRRSQHPYQLDYMTELVRVLKPGGKALVAQPNGAHPVDFWHSSENSSMRFHVPYEAWMPNAWEIRRWAHASPHPVEIKFLSPEGYLAFERVREHLYGRVLTGAMRGLFKTITRWPRLATSPLNPWLVAEITRMA